MDIPNLTLPDYYINRELSSLQFNRRVLSQARDESIPLLERLRFLCIVSRNQDEFFEIRVISLQQSQEMGSAQASPDKLSPHQALTAIGEMAHKIVAEQYQLLNESIVPGLERDGVRFVRRTRWTRDQRKWLKDYFFGQIAPVLSPISLDPARPFPRILNKSLNFIVGLEGVDAFGRPCTKAIVQAPRSLPRLIQLPEELSNTGPNDFVFLSSVIHGFVEKLFRGMQITGCFQFRVTRNSDLYVDPEEIDDLKRAIEGELMASRYGAAVRLEIAYDCPTDLADYLLTMFNLTEAELYQVHGPVNLNRLMATYDLVNREDLKYPAFTPRVPANMIEPEDIFAKLSRQEILLHHPYESFSPVSEFINRAANDPEVLAIKLALYRTSPDSLIAKALVSAAQAGKEVTVIIELRARFDEAANIKLANRLQEAGAHVVYGIVGFKTHCKMALIVRRENRELRRYVHLGTGNYHPGTARQYTDYSFFSADSELGQDVHEIFMQLTSMMQTAPLKLIYEAPFGLHEEIIARIESEIKNVAAGGTGHIIAKLNALVEPEVIQSLYKASCAGVMVDLIVRGICCLRPGIPGVSDNIRVRSIVGQFLEHSRVFYFHANGEEQIFCASADWMDRNFFQRVEIAFPILDRELKKRLTAELDIYLSDNSHAWELQPDGRYVRVKVQPGLEKISAQDHLLATLTNSG